MLLLLLLQRHDVGLLGGVVVVVRRTADEEDTSCVNAAENGWPWAQDPSRAAHQPVRRSAIIRIVVVQSCFNYMNAVETT